MSQQWIKHSEFGIDQVPQLQVFLHQVFEETNGFLPGGVANRFVEHEVFVGIDRDVIKAVQFEPLTHEGMKKGFRLGVGQHPVHLLR